MPKRGERGGASVEHVTLVALIALALLAALAALASAPPRRSARELGEVIARRIACPPRHPVPCGRNPLALAYGFPLGKLVRYLAPEPGVVAGLLPVDFRRCRRPSCARSLTSCIASPRLNGAIHRRSPSPTRRRSTT